MKDTSPCQKTDYSGKAQLLFQIITFGKSLAVKSYCTANRFHENLT